MYTRNILFFWAFEARPSPRQGGELFPTPTRGSPLNGCTPLVPLNGLLPVVPFVPFVPFVAIQKFVPFVAI